MGDQSKWKLGGRAWTWWGVFAEGRKGEALGYAKCTNAWKMGLTWDAVVSGVRFKLGGIETQVR